MLRFGLVFILSIGCVTTAYAQDKRTFQQQIRTAAAQLRAAGEPRSRCSVGASVSDNNFVITVMPGALVELGDRIISVNGQGGNRMSMEQIVSALRSLPANGPVALEVERERKLTTIRGTCLDAISYVTANIQLLDLAAAGKFEACANTPHQPGDGSKVAGVKLQCSAFSKTKDVIKQGSLAFDFVGSGVDEARYDPALLPGIMESFRNLEGLIEGALGKAKITDLKQRLSLVPGGRQALASTAPDWAAFRRSAEAALVARLVDPDSARIQWTHGFTYGTWKPPLAKRMEGYWTCGLINARNRMGGYTGSTSFVVVLSRSGAVQYADMGTGTNEFDIVSSQCAGASKILPPPPSDLDGSATLPSAPSETSLADEITKLDALKAKGVLTEAEFQTAKSRPLNGGR